MRSAIIAKITRIVINTGKLLSRRLVFDKAAALRVHDAGHVA